MPESCIQRDAPNGSATSAPQMSNREMLSQTVLLVEDEFIMGIVLATDLEEAGYSVLGPFPKVTTAMDAIASQPFDCAILDINLGDEAVYPVAAELTRRNIPFIFLTGYAEDDIPETFRPHRRLAKPAEWASILQEVRIMLR